MGNPEPVQSDDRVSLHPLGFEEALKSLMDTPPKSQTRAAALHAMTHSIPEVDEIKARNGKGFVTYEQLTRRGDARD